MPRTELIVALDLDTVAQVDAMVAAIGPGVQWYKVGKQLFTQEGPAVVKHLQKLGKRVFLDLKFHDIPNTVAQAVRAVAAIGADMTNVHASGGRGMLEAAAAAARETQVLLIAVTVLTSMNEEELANVGVQDSPGRQVVRLARLTQQAGVAGVVCSALEIEAIRAACGPEFVLVVPGIRPAGVDHGDQKRVMTPREAATAGADYIVVGRPITKAPDPAAAAAAVRRELE